LLDANDLKQIKNVMLEAMEPFLTKIYGKLLEHDRKFEEIDKRFEQVDKRFEQIDARLDRLEARMDSLENRMDSLENRMDKLEQDVAEIKGYHKDLEKTLGMIKRLFTEITFKVEKLEDKMYDLENNPEAAQKEYAAEIKREFEALKNRVSRLEKLIDRVCEAEEKYNS
jgi:chromosome segregation ATPase